MQTIMNQMKKGESKRNAKLIAERQLLQLELRLISALDFTPHKVEYYRNMIAFHKKTYNV